MPYRQSQWRTKCIVGGYDLGYADKFNDGGLSTETTNYKRATGITKLGGDPERADGTAEYLYEELLDAVYKELDEACGREDKAKATIRREPVGDDGTPLPSGGYTLTGILTGITMPNTDTASNEGAVVTMTFVLDRDLA